MYSSAQGLYPNTKTLMFSDITTSILKGVKAILSALNKKLEYFNIYSTSQYSNAKEQLYRSCCFT